MQKPTVGRIVLYRFPDHERHLNNQSPIAPAVIVAVWSATSVNLKVLNDGPDNSWRTSVQQGPGPGQWDWPVIEGRGA